MVQPIFSSSCKFVISYFACLISGTKKSQKYEAISVHDSLNPTILRILGHFFSLVTFLGREAEDCERLDNIGWKIADKWKGLPLAVNTLGSLMCFKRTKQDWQNVLESEFWELEEVERGYLCSKRSADMETLGNEYFESMEFSFFFQDFEKDYDGNVEKCGMHDISMTLPNFGKE
ncbi:Cysteine/Histidine-rich C1 domain family protein [Tripterygium wilfordii]|uniref:Cysteine/Histidine-rich C1 domain family protein n=1 Tax=Tripterygium wilfordii TaxID=458696 RepID=A0A7J7D618_TRIWF|nr:Cysteine/Histidine-rich C1 domain family protein [Tripterygium wilfordii]